MRNKFLAAVALAALSTSMTGVAQANDEGWYLRGNAGYGIHTDMDADGGITSLNDAMESEGNVALSLGVGYDFGNNWRLELDGDTLWTDLGAIGETPSSYAKLRTNSVMLNAIYDFDDFGRWSPFVGAGLGWVQGDARLEAHDLLNPLLTQSPACPGPRAPLVNRFTYGFQGESCSINGTSASLGWQVLAGLGYDITDNLSWDTHYTYMDGGSMDFDGVRTNGVFGTTNPISSTLTDVGAHSLVTGFRYKFGDRAPKVVPTPDPVADYECWNGDMVFNAGECPAKPEPKPEVQCWDGAMVFNASECSEQPEVFTCPDGTLTYDEASCPAIISDRGNDMVELCGAQYRQEIIYYDFDKGQSAETRNTINRILDIGQYCQVNNISVVGHTDSSGSASYNLGLSKRRAKDARDELVRQGVDEALITSTGKGESEPFIDRGDGVKEQLNRRTEVLISLNEVGVIN